MLFWQLEAGTPVGVNQLMYQTGRVIMSLAIIAYTVLPPIVDLTTNTHVFHEGWLPHARMHTVWLLGVTSSVGLLALYFLWLRGGDTRRFNTHLAATLSLLVFGSFFVSAGTMTLYGGALTDVARENTVILGLDGNVLLFSSATVLLLIGWMLCTARAD